MIATRKLNLKKRSLMGVSSWDEYCKTFLAVNVETKYYELF